MMQDAPLGPILVAHQYYRSNMPSGENVVVDREFDLLRDHGVEVIPLTNHSDDLGHLGPITKARLIPGLWPSRRRRSRLKQDLLRLRQERGVRLLHAHNLWPLHTPDLLAAAKDAGLRTILTIHSYRIVSSESAFLHTGTLRPPATPEERDDLASMPQVLDSKLKRMLYARATAAHWRSGSLPAAVDRFICMTRFQADKLAQYGIPRDRTVIKPHFVTPPNVKSAAPGDHALFVGRLTQEKGIVWLLRHWPHDRIRLHVVGTGPLAEACRSDHRVTYHGALDSDGVAQQMAHCRFLVSSSTCYETFGLVLIEALAAGKPCLVPRIGSMPEIITDGETGAVFEPDDPSSLKQQAEYLCAASQKLETRCLASYRSQFHHDENFRILRGIYRDVLEIT